MRWNSVGIFSLAILGLLAGCAGNPGPTGPVGPTGPEGPQGPGSQISYSYDVIPNDITYEYEVQCPPLVAGSSTVNAYISLDYGTTWVVLPASYYDDDSHRTYTAFSYFIQNAKVIMRTRNYAEDGYTPIVPAPFKLLVTIVNR